MSYEDFCRNMASREEMSKIQEFIMEDTLAEPEEAWRMARFIKFVSGQSVVLNPNIWVRGDRARVYFELESQNSLNPIKFAEKFYFCAAKNDIIAVYIIGGARKEHSLCDANFNCSSSFSGAKTREKIKTFVTLFSQEFSNE